METAQILSASKLQYKLIDFEADRQELEYHLHCNRSLWNRAHSLKLNEIILDNGYSKTQY